ncbi:MAG TPA: hypothetical protein VD905_19700 [Flavobacteriales bacterium]|nr:hypothetical protein [Flavobacteriales bacterium]
MAIKITDQGSNLKIEVDDSARLVAKSSVKSVAIIGDFIKIQSDACCAPWDYLPFSEINEPETETIEQMRDAIGDLLFQYQPSTPTEAGLATEARQNEAIGKLEEIKTTITTNLSGKATEALQNDQATALQNIFTLLGAIQTTVTSAAAAQATIGKQNDTITLISNLGAQLTLLQGLLISLIDEHLFLLPPSRTEDVTAELRYEGFALPGSLDAAPVWAIRKRAVFPPNIVVYSWAAGSRTKSQVWNNRAMLAYM